METSSRKYQLNCFFSPTLEQSQLDENIDKIKKIIADNQGHTREEKNSRKKLAYPINHLDEAYFLILDFEIPAEKLSELENSLRLNDNILRHMIIHQPVKTKAPVKEIKKAPTDVDLEKELSTVPEEAQTQEESESEETKEESEETPEKQSTKEKPQEDEKVDINELDKKLDEILNK